MRGPYQRRDPQDRARREKISASHAKGEAGFLTEEPVDAGRLKDAIAATGYTCLSVESAPYVKKGWFGLG